MIALHPLLMITTHSVWNRVKHPRFLGGNHHQRPPPWLSMIEGTPNASCSPGNLHLIEKWTPNCDKWLLSPANPSGDPPVPHSPSLLILLLILNNKIPCGGVQLGTLIARQAGEEVSVFWVSFIITTDVLLCNHYIDKLMHSSYSSSYSEALHRSWGWEWLERRRRRRRNKTSLGGNRTLGETQLIKVNSFNERRRGSLSGWFLFRRGEWEGFWLSEARTKLSDLPQTDWEVWYWGKRTNDEWTMNEGREGLLGRVKQGG